MPEAKTVKPRFRVWTRKGKPSYKSQTWRPRPMQGPESTVYTLREEATHVSARAKCNDSIISLLRQEAKDGKEILKLEKRVVVGILENGSVGQDHDGWFFRVWP